MMKFEPTSVLVVILFINSCFGEYYKTKPNFVKTCYKKDTEFEACSKIAVQSLFNALGPGLPEIDIPPLEPLHIPKIRILQGDGPVNVNAALDDVIVTGFGQTQVLSSQVIEGYFFAEGATYFENYEHSDCMRGINLRVYRVDSKTYDFYTKVLVPKLRIEGTYDLKGKILLIPLVGRGLCWFEPTNMTIDIVSDVKLYEKDNYTFFNVTGAHVKYSIGGLQLRMNNLFDGIKSLEESTNSYLNANWRPVSESLRPILSKTIEDILLGFMEQLFHNLPGNFMIGDIKNHSAGKKTDKKV